MPLLSKNFGDLSGGISQQNPAQRLPNQAEDMLNVIGDLRKGLTKRPSTTFVEDAVGSNADSTSFVHFYQRDPNEVYAIIFTGDSSEPIEVYDLLTGASQLVTYQDNDAKTYAQGVNRASTIADVSICVDSSVTTAMESTTSAAQDPTAYIWVKNRVASADVTVTVERLDGSSSFTGTALGPASGDTDTMAANIVTMLGGASFGTASQIDGDSSVVKFTDPTPFRILTKDQYGDEHVILINGETDNIANFPPNATDGDIIELKSSTDGYDGVFFKFNRNTSTWSETLATNVEYSIDPETMPHQLIRTAGGSFDFRKIDWSDKLVGNDTSNPNPSFIGNTIERVFTFKSRLGILSNDAVIMSRVGDFFNFFVESALELLDDDPIDITAPSSRIVKLQNVVPFQNSLLLGSDFQQFIMNVGNDNVLSPTTASLEVTTSYNVDNNIDFVTSGSNAYFVGPSKGFSAVYEYFVNSDAVINEAAEITAHVNQLIPNNITSIAASSTENILVLFNKTDKVYVYRYLWSGNEKVQAEWTVWQFSEKALDGFWVDNELYMVFDYTNGGSEYISIDKLDIEDPNNSTIGWPIYLDKIAQVNGVYDADSGYTFFGVPYRISDPTTLDIINSGGLSLDFEVVTGPVVITEDGLPITEDGSPIYLDGASTTLLKVLGDWSANPVHIGIPFESSYKFSEWVLRNEQGPIEGRMNITHARVRFRDTGDFDFKVTPENRSTMITRQGGLEPYVTLFGAASLKTDTRKFLVKAINQNTTIEISSSSHLPLVLENVELNGRLSKRR